MPFYFLLSRLTDEGRRMVHSNHQMVVDTAREVNVEGAEILGQYAVLGRYDYVMMVEADDNDAVARLSVELGVRSGLHIETLPAIAIGFLDRRIVDDPVWTETGVQTSPGE
jgi:uncharacterized protein with GYD domain